MFYDQAIYLSRQLLWHALVLSAPLVFAALLSGLITSIFQVATQLQDSSLNFVPKLLCFTATLIFTSHWMLHALTEFAQTLLSNIPGALR